MKRAILIASVLLFVFIDHVFSQSPGFQGVMKELFQGESIPSKHNEWLIAMEKWRVSEKKSLNYEDSIYLKPELDWTKRVFIYTQMMASDRYFYDPVHRKYTVERYLDDVKRRYGGLDAVLIWPTYPNIGIDDRNQFDMLADMPGGLAGVRQMVNDFKKMGVRVFFSIMFWDNGTRSNGIPMSTELVKEMKELDADGLNGDTMNGVTEDFENASENIDFPLAFQPELSIENLKMVEWNTMSWGYWFKSWDNFKYDYRPGVSVYKWLEPKHQVTVTNRWAIDKTDDLQYAFFNGVGYNAWENVFGVWNQIPKRYEAAIKRIATIYRQFPSLWSSSDWQPYIPTMQEGVFASVFPGIDQRIYTFINRDSTDKRGKQIELSWQNGMLYYDIWNGKKLLPLKVGDHIYLNFPVEGNGFGAVLAVKPKAVNPGFKDFLAQMHSLSKKPLKLFSKFWEPLLQHIVPIKKTIPYTKAPEGMIMIPVTKNFVFESKGITLEGDQLPDAVGIQHPWEKHPSRIQKKTMNITSFFIDKYPVTNKQFKQFIDATKYHPDDDHNFLKNWENGTYPSGWDEKPVTWVSIEDAKAYAAWAGKRLPHEWEWQYAAQGLDGRLYPWGNKKDTTKMPLPDGSRVMRTPTDVDAFPQGASPFGVIDMMGNVWQWTDEYDDLHTRSAILKGGSYYRPMGSKWYFPKANELNQYGKYLLMAPGIDRSAAIGFRCVADKSGQ